MWCDLVREWNFFEGCLWYTIPAQCTSMVSTRKISHTPTENQRISHENQWLEDKILKFHFLNWSLLWGTNSWIFGGGISPTPQSSASKLVNPTVTGTTPGSRFSKRCKFQRSPKIMEKNIWEFRFFLICHAIIMTFGVSRYKTLMYLWLITIWSSNFPKFLDPKSSWLCHFHLKGRLFGRDDVSSAPVQQQHPETAGKALHSIHGWNHFWGINLLWTKMTAWAIIWCLDSSCSSTFLIIKAILSNILCRQTPHVVFIIFSANFQAMDSDSSRHQHTFSNHALSISSTCSMKLVKLYHPCDPKPIRLAWNAPSIGLMLSQAQLDGLALLKSNDPGLFWWEMNRNLK